jgi:hypothetical protein
MAIALAMVLPQIASAQSFSFGISSGGGHHHGHHHHGCYGPAWGFSYYRPPPPVYVYPAAPPVTYVYPASPVAVVQPTQPAYTAAAPVALPAPPTSRVASTPINSVPLASRADVTIRNPANTGGPVAFIVGEQMDAELASGTTRTWSDRSSLTVEFDRGGNYGSERKILRPGQYDFVVTESGWDLVAATGESGNLTAGRSNQVQRNSLPGRR